MTRRRWLRVGLVAGVASVWGAACARGTEATWIDASAPDQGEGGTASGDAREELGPLDGGTQPEATGPTDARDDLASSDGGTTGDADSGGGADATQPPGDGALTCTGGKIVCLGACVDPTSDPANCGGCATSCGTGICGLTIAADMSVIPLNWTFNGVAAWDPDAGPSARMTPAKAASVAGTVVYNHAIVTDGFTASFQFRMGANGGGRYDGMGFMIETNGATALGQPAAALGMAGLVGYGVEFDVYNNSGCGDLSADHVGIDSLQACPGTTMPTSLFAGDLTGTVDLADAQWHAAIVQLAGYTMSVTVDGHPVATNVTLTSFAPGATYYFGFSGGTGGNPGSGGIQTEVKAVTITFPTPRCL